MRSEDLSLSFVSVTLNYPPLPRFSGTELPEFYSEVCKRHQFDSFRLVGDSGALLETEAERRLKIDRDAFIYDEYLRGSRSFPLVKQRAADLVSDAAQHFGQIRLFLLQDCTLRALWPVPEAIEDVEAELREQAFKIREDQFAQLGGISGVGMHLTGHRGEHGNFGWGVEIAPYFPEERNLFIEVNSHAHEPMTTSDEVADFIDTTYRFLTDNVVDFVNTFL